jgi:hypothetical protein
MFKDAGAMWSSVRGGNTSSPVSAVAMLQKRGGHLRVRDTNTPGLHAAGGTTSGK